MSANQPISLVELPSGSGGTVVRFDGGRQFVGRLTALGVRLGKRIRKVSGMPLGGPITVQVDSTQVAIGGGMASRIFVELEEGG